MSTRRRPRQLSKKASGIARQLLSHIEHCKVCQLPADQVAGGRDLVLCPVGARLLRQSGVRAAGQLSAHKS